MNRLPIYALQSFPFTKMKIFISLNDFEGFIPLDCECLPIMETANAYLKWGTITTAPETCFLKLAAWPESALEAFIGTWGNWDVSWLVSNLLWVLVVVVSLGNFTLSEPSRAVSDGAGDPLTII